MPAYDQPTGGGEDMYSDAAPATEEAPAEAPENPEGTGETAVVPQSLCPGMKAGDEFNVKIERVLENDYEISYPEKQTPEAAPAAPAGGEMAGMME